MKSMYRGYGRIVTAVFLLLISISGQSEVTDEVIGELPEAVANNAVAVAKINNHWQLFSFNGLESGKDWNAVSNIAMRFDLASGQGYQIEPVPYESGRLASIAATVSNNIYLFGGYTVAENHEEKSTPEVYRFDPQTRKFTVFSKMPTPVDDSVALVYQQRYIYLISGWHDVGNVTDVQVLDTISGKWHQASSYPGKPVFGHAAGIVGNQIVVVDGVKVASVVEGKRLYKISPESYLGVINPNDFTQINWKKLPAHPGKAKYRMAAVGSERLQKIIFAAGSDNPYNFNGVGYDGIPSNPSNQMFAWNLKTNSWQKLPSMKTATMDHRGLLEVDRNFYIVGGMRSNQRVSNQVLKLSGLEL